MRPESREALRVGPRVADAGNVPAAVAASATLTKEQQESVKNGSCPDRK